MAEQPQEQFEYMLEGISAGSHAYEYILAGPNRGNQNNKSNNE